MFYALYGSDVNLTFPNSKFIDDGKLIGWKLVFNNQVDVVETNDEEDDVSVSVWNVAKEDMDCFDTNKTYTTKEASVMLSDGSIKTALVYTMKDKHKGVCPPDRRYFDSLVRDYINNDFDIEPLYDALDYSYENKS